MRGKFGVVFLFCLLAILSSARLKAQITSSTLYGQVMDATGAAVPGTQVSVSNTDTNLTRTMETNSAGEYRIELLPVGNYRVEVSKTGFKKVALEIGTQSIALAEELALTMAELSYLQERRQAYDNLARRTDLDGVKSVCMALQQAERYGTPIGQTLRVMAQENRDMRMAEAEKKAAALPPKLTVPMIVFFLPVLFVVILGPAGIRVSQMNVAN